jgi:type IV pilus assembly protein PilO
MQMGLKEAAAFFIVLGMMGASYFVGFKPMKEQRDQLQADIQTKKAALENLRVSLTVVANMQKKIDDISKSIRFFDSRLPRDKEIQPIIEGVWKTAEKHSLSADRVRMLKVENGPNFLEQPIELELVGDFNGFYQFISELERMSRIIRLGKLDLKHLEKDPSKVQVKMTMSIYYTPDSQNVADVR